MGHMTTNQKEEEAMFHNTLNPPPQMKFTLSTSCRNDKSATAGSETMPSTEPKNNNSCCAMATARITILREFYTSP